MKKTIMEEMAEIGEMRENLIAAMKETNMNVNECMECGEVGTHSNSCVKSE